MFIDQWALPACKRGAQVALVAAVASSAVAEGVVQPRELAALVADDPSVKTIEFRAQAESERVDAVAALPDPKLRVGAFALPIDTFDLNQEPVTQLQLGLSQRFLPGDTRELLAQQKRASAAVMNAQAQARYRAVLMQARVAFIEARFYEREQAILERSIESFADLRQRSEDAYAAGKASQQGVFEAELALMRAQDSLHASRQQEQTARERLARWIGSRAHDALGSGAMAQVPDEVSAAVDAHPAVIALDEQQRRASVGVDLAREQYKPGWSVDVAYGDRSGQNLDGSARADFVFASVTVDLPTFGARRRDADLAAAQREADAVSEARLDLIQSLAAEFAEQQAALRELKGRLTRFETQLLEQAEANEAAALEAFQSGLGDISDLLRARITTFDIERDYERARMQQDMAVARLSYITGESL